MIISSVSANLSDRAVLKNCLENGYYRFRMIVHFKLQEIHVMPSTQFWLQSECIHENMCQKNMLICQEVIVLHFSPYMHCSVPLGHDETACTGILFSLVLLSRTHFRLQEDCSKSISL